MIGISTNFPDLEEDLGKTIILLRAGNLRFCSVELKLPDPPGPDFITVGLVAFKETEELDRWFAAHRRHLAEMEPYWASLEQAKEIARNSGAKCLAIQRGNKTVYIQWVS